MVVYVIENNEKVDRFLNVGELSITYSANDTASVNISVSPDIIPYLVRKAELLVEEYGESINIVVDSFDYDFGASSVSISTSSLFTEWSKESVPVNISKKSASVKTLMTDKNFYYTKTPWQIEFDGSPELNQTFDFEFSRETKEDVLTKAIEMTTDVVKRFPRNSTRVLELGVFGQKKEYKVSKMNMIGSANVSMDATNICNLVVPLSDKSDGGSSALTLRDLVSRPDLTDPDFPIINTNTSVNTQGTQIAYSFPQYAPNNKNEYGIIDVAGLELEDGEFFESTFTANDIQPIQEDGKTISNADRIKATQTLYQTAVRFLKTSRRQLTFTATVADLPQDVDVLDKIKFKYDQWFPNITECMNQCEKEVYRADDWFYITQIEMTLGMCGWTYNLTLNKDLASILGSRVN